MNKQLFRDRVLISWSFACLSFFISLGILTPPAANWFMAGVTTVFGAIPILIFCVLGAALLIRLEIIDKTVIYLVGGAVGAVLGVAGYFIANYVAYFDSLPLAFVISGAVAGFVVAASITANK